MNYFKYVKIYLEYISYLDNFCRTTAEERIKAAEIYIEIYIP